MRSAAVTIECHVGHNEMVLGIDCGLHIITDESGVLAARRHRTRIRISQRDLLVLALHHLGIDRAEPRDLIPQFRDFDPTDER
jgi:hypothetical protein